MKIQNEISFFEKMDSDSQELDMQENYWRFCNDQSCHQHFEDEESKQYLKEEADKVVENDNTYDVDDDQDIDPDILLEIVHEEQMKYQKMVLEAEQKLIPTELKTSEQIYNHLKNKQSSKTVN